MVDTPTRITCNERCGPQRKRGDGCKKQIPGVSKLLASLGHTGRRKVVLGHKLNTQTLTKTDEQKKKKKGFK